ncbi:MAG TPA: 30S ribosomal protein S6 [Acidimicrobiales bacterium]|nr:30S ribosomal protein S6 [Acidimicrobiales bacterium]
MTRAYELMVILDGSIDDNVVTVEVEKIATQAAECGEIVTTDVWGRRAFAYEIDHKHDGHYMVFEILGEPGSLDPLDRALRLADEVVRHKIIRLPDSEAARRGLLGGEAAPAVAG